MTVQEFTDTSHTLTCRDCQSTGLSTQHNPNNNSLLVVCPHCLSKRPLSPLLVNLRQDKNAKKARRSDYPPDQGLYDVWERFGHRCAMCCLEEADLLLLGIGRTRHHVTDNFKNSGHDCQIIPLCTGCKTLVDHRQRESGRWITRLKELRAQSIPTSRAEVSPDGVSPDSVSPEGQDSTAVMERFSDHDAH
jgi:hypothetical protein